METVRPVNLVINAVSTFDNRDGEAKRAWRPIGIAFPHKTTMGFNLRLDLLPFAAQEIVLSPAEDDRELAPLYHERLTVYAVKKFEQGGEQKDFWARIGVAFPNKLGGFNLKLELLPLVGQDLVMLPPRSKEDRDAA
jgi:hypothetical protein